MKNYRDHAFENRVECSCFFEKLAKLLEPYGYRVVGSCNKDKSMYLIPEGTESQLSYYGKPVLSFRISDHWNWYSSPSKCSETWRIQCFNRDMPWARRRTNPNVATKPIIGWQVAFYTPDNEYQCVYGDKFDRKTKTWGYVRNKPEDIVKMLFGDEALYVKTA